VSSHHDVRTLDRSHGPALLELTRACPIQADFTFLFARDPDFFAWPDAVFDRYEYRGILEGNRLVAAGLVAVVNGVTGYGRDLYAYGGDLRVLPGARGRGAGTSIIRDFVARPPEGPDAGYVLVKDGNAAGMRMVDRGDGQGALPGQDLGPLLAMSIPLVRRVRGPGVCQVRRARPGDVEQLAATYARTLAHRPFAPVLTADRIVQDAVRIPGMGLDRYFVALRAGRLVGALAAWDERALRRTVILRYALRGQLQRAAFWAASRAFRAGARMPRPGEPLHNLTVSRLAVQDDDPGVLADLLAAVTAEHAGDGHHLLALGLPGGDPLLPGLRGFMAIPFTSRVFGVRAKDPGLPALPPSMGRPYLDLALI
jgi:GNAT superfamily N-acetyltransferase